jgi:ribonuclease HII
MERAYFADGCAWVAGSDEVGRGSLGGPVSAGIVVVDPSTGRIPAGLRDSKLLTPAAHRRIFGTNASRAAASAVGHASAAEIDAMGILAALRLAGERALAALAIEPSVIVLDGNYDWFSRPPRATHSPRSAAHDNVVLRIKADLTCASVAAASVIAKVERDALMRELGGSHPAYGWSVNKGYATPEHLAALRDFGPCVEHRRSWRLPGDDSQLVFELAD